MPFSVMMLVLLGALLHATWNGLVKSGSDRYLDTLVVLMGAAFLTLCWLPFLPLPARASWPYLAISMVIHEVYYLLIVLSYGKGDLSLVYPLTRGTAPAFTALFSALVFAETPSPGSGAGVLLVSCGVLLLAFDHRRSERFHRTPVVLALLNAGVIVLYTLTDGTGVRLSGNALSYTSWGFLLCALPFVPVALVLRRREALRHIGAEWKRGLVGGGCSLASYGLALWAMTRAPIASVAALRETSILFGVLIAAFTLKERVSGLRFGAALSILAGAVAIKFG